MAHIHEQYDFTSSAYILHPSHAKICLHYHRKLNTWLQPGGHIELNEDPIEALIRELQEEVGLKVGQYEIIGPETIPQMRGSKVLPVPAILNVHPYNEVHRHIDYGFVIKSHTENLSPQEGESVEIDWFSLEEISEMLKNGRILDGTYDVCKWILEKYV
ncbi:MAG TPA: NUDIX domain-containing protein [Candidatus Saccharibacteria bacterium]|jgi:8-oxo-dGTP diphosphatase|nr:NUDIX domain-containing protein [Candidatus Saccharibacteria bacterium]